MKFLYLLALLHGDPTYASMLTVMGPFEDNLQCMVSAMGERDKAAAEGSHYTAGCVVEGRIREMLAEHACVEYVSPTQPFDPNATSFLCKR